MAQDESRRSGNAVVELLSSRDTPAGRSILRELEDHWREIRDASGWLPRRADLDAGRIAAALPHAFVGERVAPGVARLRIAGRSLVGLLGAEARGLPLSLLFAPSARPALQAWVERCFAAPAVVDLAVMAGQGAFRAPVSGRLLLLPMLDADGQVTRVLGGLLLDSTLRRGPAKLELRGEEVRCWTVPAACPVLSAAALASLPGLREAARPWLRLVVSNG